jgi:GT2 family glycosyltransferase/ubiquinone/menaquinone biosynthesis C-methylase UbiE/glycosyltransferase involved in cell wall biosynthesis
MKEEPIRMDFSGERYVPELSGNIELEHLHRYLLACQISNGKTVLDIASGEGYGSAMLAKHAAKVIGVDISPDAVMHARQRYVSHNLQYMVGSCSEIPLPDSSIDLIVSFETIEHHDQHDQMMAEIKRVLRPSGALLISSPDKYYYTVETGTSNPYHVKELYAHEFKRLLEDRFEHVSYFGQRIAYGSLISSENLCSLTSNYLKEQSQLTESNGTIRPLYWVAVASNAKLPEIRTGILETPINASEIVQSWASVVQQRDNKITELDGRVTNLCKVVSDIERESAELRFQIDDSKSLSKRLELELSELASERLHFERENAELRIQLDDSTTLRKRHEVELGSLASERLHFERECAELRTQLTILSNWAAYIDAHTVKHAFKKTALGIARGTLRSMPVSVATKQRLRDVFFSIIRPLRQSVRHKSVKVYPADETAQPMAQTVSASVKRVVFVFAVIDWHFRTQRPQHIARSLAEGGHQVFYFSNHFCDADEPGYQLERLPGADSLYQVKLHVKGAPAIYFDAPSDQALAMLTRSIAKVIDDFKAVSSFSIVQHAYWYPLVKRLPNSYHIYDCMDHHEGFGNVPANLLEIEKDLLRRADLVTVTSSWLEDFARQHNPNVALVRNAAEYAHFVTRPEQVYVDRKGRRIIGYYGAIAEWFDLDLVRAIALEHPNCLILLVGNDTVGARRMLADLPNVEFTGEVPYTKLPFYLHAFDVCLLPFKVIPLTLATNPVKVYEYLSAGKPVVCVDLPEVGQFQDLVSRASSLEDFVMQVSASLKESGVVAEQKSAERRSFASEQTWCHRAAQLSTALETIRIPRVSVIILTFNNLDLTRACLDSVLLRSDYPNLEVIVVDNGSSDNTPAYLKDLACRHPEVRVVINSENLGFAAGNNTGLSIATGDYLVILNNDTVVTQGWVMTLVRHFQNDPSVGIVGPVTNNIGNEARIETRYQSIEAMPGEALRHTLANMGKTSPMRTAAFFCVMFSRSVYELCGPICEDYGRGFFEDDDYCRRVEKVGFRIVCAEDVFIHHHLSASFNKLKRQERQQLFDENKKIYEAKWGKWIPHNYRSTAKIK